MEFGQALDTYAGLRKRTIAKVGVDFVFLSGIVSCIFKFCLIQELSKCFFLSMQLAIMHVTP